MTTAFCAAGWYGPAWRYPSPNCDDRPAGAAIDLLVIHNASLPLGQFGTPHLLDLFTNRVDFTADPSFESLRGLTVSAHFLVRRDGRIIQFVPTALSAWHAGVSSHRGREACNGFSVGIEMEGSDFVPFTPAQYTALASLTAALLAAHPISAIAGHQHIAPGRKTDPGPYFDWARYAAMLAALRPGAAPPAFPE
ncbi:1,6-anhydro-N-acetylmuramyl-L-alanine amidase AmpD [Massilia sp. TS11]|uniref:1,6-anhydro-N-acetylmuramyl-L-alanine amidase AmpD n=1 Tax=Massilia sp. TS11 TaxID=2908003 RepID=UPI001EDC1804|nr:1,6-anhydro-N-acetylmuramyl-L-alanine amidase AmpD [Massilia sp. TS11]MCG2583419.1 1,6-anhydro-N-acetylmuramyl-L-alanine amidase AmpD [Massilia sp. TS11]